jgi:Leucine-rich repeat (LRR) protein
MLKERQLRKRNTPFVFALCLACAFALFACAPGAASGTNSSAESKPTTLDLSNKGITDVSDLAQQTQLTNLDLRGNELSRESFDALKVALPNCDILWSVPIASARYDSSLTALSLDSASADLPDMLAYFPALQSLTLSTPPDDAIAAALAEKYPALKFQWDLTIAGTVYPADTTELDLTGKPVDFSVLLRELVRLPNLRQVTFGEDVFALADQIALAKAYPAVAFIWNVQLLDDLTLRSDVTDLDLREYQVPDAAAFSDKLVLFPKLTRLDMCGTGPSNEEMAAMRERYPAIKFIWYIQIYHWTLRTDIKGFSTGQRREFPDGAGWYDGSKFNYSRFHSEGFENLKYCTDLIALDVGHCGNIGDVEFLRYLPQLKYLDIALCDLKDISVLSNLPDLVYLQMMYNYIADVSPLANCTKLRFVNASNNVLLAADAFLQMPNLERLWINCSGLSDEQISELVQKLPNVSIKASQDNPEYAMSLWCKGNEGYVTVQALYGLRAKFQ